MIAIDLVRAKSRSSMDVIFKGRSVRLVQVSQALRVRPVDGRPVVVAERIRFRLQCDQVT